MKKNKIKSVKEMKSKRPGSKKMDPVVHFELPAEDRKRMAKFYSSAFNWKTKMLGEEHGNYVLASTSETEKNGTPTHRGIINGGFYTKDENKPEQHPSIVIAVEDINKSMKKIENAGGKVLGEPMEIPGFGFYVSFLDTEGNRVSIMQPTMVL